MLIFRNTFRNVLYCRLFVKKTTKSMYYKLRRCRRSYKDEFVAIFTKILNRHAHGKYKFTEELTSVSTTVYFVFVDTNSF